MTVAWGIGHMGHLFADYIGGMIAHGYSFLPWFFPLRHYEFPKGYCFFTTAFACRKFFYSYLYTVDMVGKKVKEC